MTNVGDRWDFEVVTKNNKREKKTYKTRERLDLRRSFVLANGGYGRNGEKNLELTAYEKNEINFDVDCFDYNNNKNTNWVSGDQNKTRFQFATYTIEQAHQPLEPHMSFGVEWIRNGK